MSTNGKERAVEDGQKVAKQRVQEVTHRKWSSPLKGPERQRGDNNERKKGSEGQLRAVRETFLVFLIYIIQLFLNR